MSLLDILRKKHTISGLRRKYLTTATDADSESLRLFRENIRLTALVRSCPTIPLPPGPLMMRVAGYEDPNKFLGAGQHIVGDIAAAARNAFGPAHRGLRTYTNVLDFGCGCGRVTRFMPWRRDQITGVDVDAEAIDWCRKNLDEVARFKATNPMPPLPFDENEFDLIFAGSVFTHLPADMEEAWLRELTRLLQPGGALVASLLGPSTLDPADQEGQSRLNRDGFYYKAGCKTEGLPDFYSVTFHTKSYVARTWTQSLELLLYHERGVVAYQDAVVLTKKA